MLGLRKSANELTSTIKKVSKIPMISKLADAREFLTSTGMEMLECDIQASHIYDSLVAEKFGNKPVSEFSREIVIVD